jgi:hypothetical protein
MLSTTMIGLACALDCETDHPAAASAEHCHEATTTPTKIATGHDCGDHSVRASEVSIARTESLNVFSPASLTALATPAALSRTIKLNLAVASSTKPPDLHITPLRI